MTDEQSKQRERTREYLKGRRTGVVDPRFPDSARGAAEYHAEAKARAALYDPKNQKAIADGVGFYMAKIFPVVISWFAINTAIFQLAVLVGLLDEAPSVADAVNNRGEYAGWLVFVFLGVVIAVFIFNKVFRGKVGWLITVSFLVWLFAAPPSDAMIAAREKGLLREQNTALDAAVLGLAGCRYNEETTRRTDNTGMWANHVFCADESKALDDLLRSVLPEVIDRHCSTRQQQTDNRAGFEAAMWREPQMIQDRCSK